MLGWDCRIVWWLLDRSTPAILKPICTIAILRGPGPQLSVPYATESVIQASVSAGLSCDRFPGTSVKSFAP